MRALGGLISLARFVFGIAFIARPQIMDRAWIGRQARVPGAQVLARAVGARDLAVGLGGVQAVARDDGSAAPWLRAAGVFGAGGLRAPPPPRPPHPQQPPPGRPADPNGFLPLFRP